MTAARAAMPEARRLEPYEVPGIGLVPMLYIEAWAVEQAFRRLGFPAETVWYIVAKNGDGGMVLDNVLHVVLRAQDKEFVYTLEQVERSPEEAGAMISRLKQALADEKSVSETCATELYRATMMGALDGRRFAQLAELLILKGFVLPALTN